MDPTRFWQQWYAATSRALQAGAAGAAPGGPGMSDAFADPWGLAAQWFAAAGAPPPSAPFAAPGTGSMPNPLDPAALWQSWMNSMLAAVPGMAPGAQPGFGTPAGVDPFGLVARWQEMLRAASVPPGTAAPPPLPPDPWTAFRQWYDAVSGPWAKAIDELVGSTAFAESAGKFLDGYASSLRALRRNSEQFAAALQLATRSDIARVAGLVVALEEKVDGIEQAQEAAADRTLDAARESSATAAALDARLSRLEARLDRLLVVAERLEHGIQQDRAGHSEPTPATPATSAPSGPSAAAASNGSGGVARSHKPSTTTRASRRRTASAP